ncbi:MAG: hypothetical protein WKF77_08770 [Planctomycetaceae bacterium]
MNARHSKFELWCARIPYRMLSVLMVAVVTHSLAPCVALAQRDEPAKDIARGLLRALIESQLEKQDRDHFHPGQKGQPPAPIPAQIPQPAQPTTECQQIRTLLATMVQEANTLTALLSNDARRSPEVRNRLADVVSFQASVTAAKQQADRHNHHLSMQVMVQALDQTWKPLSYQLSALHGVSQQTKDTIDRMTRMDLQLCRFFGIQEQFNSRELVRAADLLAADLRTLTDDAGYAATTADNRSRLVVKLRRHQERAAYFANLAATGAQFPTVVAEYQNLHQAWQGLRTDLDQDASRGVTRTVARIEETHRMLHQLLRLEYRFDEPFVKRLADGIDRDISEMFRTITLEQIMTLPDSRSLPVVADALLGNCQNLSDVIARRESLQEVGEAWLYLDEQWQLFAYYLNPVQVAETRRRAEGISQSLETLKTAIGVSVAYDRTAVRQQATAVDSLADLLQTTSGRWLIRPGQQNVALAAELQKMGDRCRQLTALATANRDRSAILATCDEVIGLWQQIRPQLSQCQTQERESIEQIIDELTHALLHLRTMLGE